MHSVRVDDGVWRAALARARSEGVTVTDVVVRALADYGRPGPPEPPPPEVVEDAIVMIERTRKPRRPRAAAPVAAELAADRAEDRREAEKPPLFPCCRHCHHGGPKAGHEFACTKCERGSR